MDKKRAKITPEHVAESKALKRLWDARAHKCSQESFGSRYDMGCQSNVGHYLNGRSALNIKAALAFAKEIGCQVSDFSPRISAEMALIGATDTGESAGSSAGNALESPKVVYKIARKSKRQRSIESLLQTVENINDDGVQRLIGMAEVLSQSHPVVVKQTRK